MRKRIRVFSAAILGMCALGSSAFASNAASLFEDIYGTEAKQVKSTTRTDDDVAFAEKLFEEAGFATSNPAFQKVILRKAFEFAAPCKSGRPLAIKIRLREIEDMSSPSWIYANALAEVTNLQHKVVKALSFRQKDAKVAESNFLIECQSNLADVYMSLDSPESAMRVLNRTLKTARSIKEWDKVTELKGLIEELRPQVVKYRKLNALKVKATRNPDDKTANQELGRYLLTVMGRIEEAQAYLEKGGESKERSVLLLQAECDQDGTLVTPTGLSDQILDLPPHELFTRVMDEQDLASAANELYSKFRNGDESAYAIMQGKVKDFVGLHGRTKHVEPVKFFELAELWKEIADGVEDEAVKGSFLSHAKLAYEAFLDKYESDDVQATKAQFMVKLLAKKLEEISHKSATERLQPVKYVYKSWSQTNLKDWDTSKDPARIESGILVFSASNGKTSGFTFKKSAIIDRIVMEFSVDEPRQALDVFVGQNWYRLHIEQQTIGYDRMSLAITKEVKPGGKNREPEHEVMKRFKFQTGTWYTAEIVIEKDIITFRIDGADILRAKAGDPGAFALIIEQPVATRIRRIELSGKGSGVSDHAESSPQKLQSTGKSVEYIYDWSQGANLKDWYTKRDPLTIADGALNFSKSTWKSSKFAFKKPVVVNRVVMEIYFNYKYEDVFIFIGKNAFPVFLSENFVGYGQFAFRKAERNRADLLRGIKNHLRKSGSFRFKRGNWYIAEARIDGDEAVLTIDKRCFVIRRVTLGILLLS